MIPDSVNWPSPDELAAVHREVRWPNGCEYADFYSRVAERAEWSSFVEIGAHCGVSAAHLFGKLKERGGDFVITCVDTWQTEPDINEYGATVGKRLEKKIGAKIRHPLGTAFVLFCANVSKAGAFSRRGDVSERQRVDVLLLDSVSASRAFDPQSVDFVYIDGAHDYTSVCADIMAWLPIVRPGGMIAGHDYCRHDFGVRRAVDLFFPNAEIDPNTRFGDGVWMVQL